MSPDELDDLADLYACQTCRSLAPCDHGDLSPEAHTVVALIAALREAWDEVDDLAQALAGRDATVEFVRGERDKAWAEVGRQSMAEDDAHVECVAAVASLTAERDKAEAAIARVRALCDEAEADLNSKHVCGPDCYCGCIYTDKVRAALGGGDE